MKMQMQKLGMLWLLVLTAGVSIGLAAEQEEKPYFVWTYEDQVKPENMETYMQAHIAQARLCAEHDFEFPYLTYVDMFRVYTCGIFDRFAKLDTFPQAWESLAVKTGGKILQIDKQKQACISHSSTSIITYRPDLSFEPEYPVFTPDFSQPFHLRVTFYHIKSDKYEEALEAARKIKELNEQKQSNWGYGLYEVFCGESVPALIEVRIAKDKLHSLQLGERNQKTLGEAIEKISNDYAHVLTKMELKEGTFVPEASYVPEGTF